MQSFLKRRWIWLCSLLVIALVAVPLAVWADVLQSDTLTSASGNQKAITLSAVPNQSQTFTVDLYIECQTKNNHINGSVTIEYDGAGSTVPAGSLSASQVIINKPAGWPSDGTNCPPGSLSTAVGTSTVTIGAPSSDGTYTYVLKWKSSDTDVDTTQGKITITLNVTTPPPSDTTPPVITKSIIGTQGLNGWYTSDVQVVWSVTDPESAFTISSGCGIDSFTADTISATSSCIASSAGGQASDSVTLKIDKTGPLAGLAVTAGTSGANGWYTSDVTVHTSGSDISPVSCTVDQVLNTDTAGTVVNGSCTNEAGLTTNATPLTIKLDKTGPSAALAVTDGIAGTNGWYTSDVTVHTLGSDISGVTCTPDQVLSTETIGTAFNGSCINEAGLATTAAPLSVKLDKTGPSAALAVTAGTAGANGWYISDVTVSTSGSDSISAPVSCSSAQVLNTDTAGTVVNGSCTNDAGLNTDAMPLTVKLDKTGPSANLAVIAGTAGTNGWYVSDVTVSTSGSDSVSEPVTCTAAQTQTDETAGQAFNGSCTNNAGLTTNTASLTIKLDKSGPSANLAVSAGTLGNNGWYVSDVTVSTTGSDSISAPVTCTANQSQTTDTTGQVFTGSCINDAGLSTNATSLTVNRDATKPVITVTAANYSLCAASTSQPSFSVTDATSGVATSSGSITSSPAAGSGVGSYIYTATATDNAGNTATLAKSYNVTYGGAFGGYLQPINTDGSSRFKLSSTIPVKFQLTCNGVPITNAVAKLYVAKGDSVPDPGVDEAISTAASTTGNLFRYSDGQYIFNLSTKLGYLNPGVTTAIPFSEGTWTLKIGLDDGSFQSVNIQIKK